MVGVVSMAVIVVVVRNAELKRANGTYNSLTCG